MNLLTNGSRDCGFCIGRALTSQAIKFTSQQAGKREITIKLGASLERPTAHGEIMYRESEDRLPQDMAQEWGTGDPVFILVTVQVFHSNYHVFTFLTLCRIAVLELAPSGRRNSSSVLNKFPVRTLRMVVQVWVYSSAVGFVVFRVERSASILRRVKVAPSHSI